MLPTLPPPSHQVSPQSCRSIQGKELSRDRNWSDIELSKLSSFMFFHKEKFLSERVRKEARIFAILSKYVKTRNVNQCRNYVHKLLNKFRDFDQIILFFRESLKNFDENYQKQQPLLKKIVFPLKMAQTVENKSEKEEKQEKVKEEMVEDKMTMKPTDVSYSDQQESKSKNVQNHSQEYLQKHPQSNKGKDCNKNSQSSHSSILDESYFSSHYFSPTQQQKKWKDCHDKFVKWTSKTAHLLEKFRDRPHFPPPF